MPSLTQYIGVGMFLVLLVGLLCWFVYDVVKMQSAERTELLTYIFWTLYLITMFFFLFDPS
jgi:hypothetical protein